MALSRDREIDIAVASRVLPLIPSPDAKAYLIRLSIQPQHPLLGHYQSGQFCPSDYGTIVADEWVRSAANRKGIEIDQWIVTPNSLQGIVFIQTPDSTVTCAGFDHSSIHQKPWILSSFIASFKAAAAKRINLRRNQLGQPVWQRNYQEQLISDDISLAYLRHQLQDMKEI